MTLSSVHVLCVLGQRRELFFFLIFDQNIYNMPKLKRKPYMGAWGRTKFGCALTPSPLRLRPTPEPASRASHICRRPY